MLSGRASTKAFPEARIRIMDTTPIVAPEGH